MFFTRFRVPKLSQRQSHLLPHSIIFLIIVVGQAGTKSVGNRAEALKQRVVQFSEEFDFVLDGVAPKQNYGLDHSIFKIRKSVPSTD